VAQGGWTRSLHAPAWLEELVRTGRPPVPWRDVVRFAVCLPAPLAVAVAVAGGIELLQWALPLGRVVSPVDAALNATGAVVAGLLTASVVRMTGPARPTRA